MNPTNLIHTMMTQLAQQRINEWIETYLGITPEEYSSRDTTQWYQYHDFDYSHCTLDLSHLNLTEIPRIPKECVEVNVSYNHLTQLDLTYLDHLYHLDCMSSWARSGRSALTCPICRAGIPRGSYFSRFSVFG